MSNHILHDDAINQAIVDHQLTISAEELRCLLYLLAAALPIPQDTPPLIADAIHQTARKHFFAMKPQDAVEAAAAVRAVAAHFAALDLFARAARPGLSDDTVMRLRTRAGACARAAEGKRRGKPQQQPAASSPPEPKPRQEPVTPTYRFQPYDRFGKPIPLQDRDNLTMAQRKATYAPKFDPEVEAAARADEARMMAEQRAMDAQASRADGDQ